MVGLGSKSPTSRLCRITPSITTHQHLPLQTLLGTIRHYASTRRNLLWMILLMEGSRVTLQFVLIDLRLYPPPRKG